MNQDEIQQYYEKLAQDEKIDEAYRSNCKVMHNIMEEEYEEAYENACSTNMLISAIQDERRMSMLRPMLIVGFIVVFIIGQVLGAYTYAYELDVSDTDQVDVPREK